METMTISEIVEQKKKELSEKLSSLRPKWPYNEMSYWCNTNDYNYAAIDRGYFKGSIASIPVAEKLIEVIEAYLKRNNIVA